MFPLFTDWLVAIIATAIIDIESASAKQSEPDRRSVILIATFNEFAANRIKSDARLVYEDPSRVGSIARSPSMLRESDANETLRNRFE